MRSKYSILGFDSVDTEQGCSLDWHADTLKEAKEKAKEMLNDPELTSVKRVQVRRGKVCLGDYFKGYNYPRY